MTEQQLDKLVEKSVILTDKNNKVASGILHKIVNFTVQINNKKILIEYKNGYMLECFDRNIIYARTNIKKCKSNESSCTLRLSDFYK